jgi:hypothetical protein
MTTGDEPTGAHPKLQVEGVANQTVLDRQTRQ